MRKDDDNWKITKRSKRCYVYEYTSLAFVFCLRSALLLLSLSLLSFSKNCVHTSASYVLQTRAHPFFFFFFFFSILCLTCSIITPILHLDVCVRRKKTNRERERTKRRKEIEYRMCIMKKKKRRMLRVHRFLVIGYEKKRRCKKDFFFFCLSIRAYYYHRNIHTFIINFRKFFIQIRLMQ